MTFTRVQVQHGFRELMGVVHLHSYYSGAIARDLEFVPTRKTELLLRNYFLNFKSMPFGFMLYYNNDHSPAILDSLPPKTKLTFKVKTKNPRFSIFTEVPFTSESQLIYFSNLNNGKEDFMDEIPPEVFYYFKNLSFGERQKYLLHSSDYPVVNAKGDFFFHPLGDRQLANGKTISYKDIQISDVFGDESHSEKLFYKKGLGSIREKEINQHLEREREKNLRMGINGDELQQKLDALRTSIVEKLESEAMSGVPVDLRHVPDGRFRLRNGKEELLDFYTLENPDDSAFGLLDIYLTTEDGSSKLKHYVGPENRYFDPQMYLMNFGARATYWRYWFMNYPNSKVLPTEVFDETGKIKFTEPVETQLETMGAKAWKVETTEPILLQENPQESIWMKRMQGKRPMKDLRLKIPAPDTIKPYRQNDGFKIFSDVYIYL